MNIYYVFQGPEGHDPGMIQAWSRRSLGIGDWTLTQMPGSCLDHVTRDPRKYDDKKYTYHVLHIFKKYGSGSLEERECLDHAWIMRASCLVHAWIMLESCQQGSGSLKNVNARIMHGSCPDHAWIMPEFCRLDAFDSHGKFSAASEGI